MDSKHLQCPKCKGDMLSLIVKWMELDGKTGFVYFCPICEERITKEYLTKNGCL